MPDHLEREDVTLDVEAQSCPCCGGAIHQIGETVSEMLDYVPARLRVIRVCQRRFYITWQFGSLTVTPRC